MKANISIFFPELWRILRLLDSRLKIRSGFVLLLILAQSLLELSFIVALTSMGMALTNSAGLRATVVYKGIFYFFPALDIWAEPPHNLLMLTGVIVVLVSITKNIVNYLTAQSIALLGEDISLSLGTEIMERFLYRDYAWHLSPESSSMFQCMMWRSNLGLMLTHLLSMYALLITIVVLFSSLVGQEPVLTTMIIGITGVIGAVLYGVVRKKVDKSATNVAKSDNEFTRALLCATKGVREVLIYRQQPAFLKSLVQAAFKGRGPRTFINIASTLPTWVLEVTGFVVVVLSTAFMVYVQHSSTERITTALALLILTSWRVLPFCNRIVSLQISVRGLRPMTNAVLELLEKLRQSPAQETFIPDPHFSFSESVSLDNVYFCYPTSDTNSLQDITLTIQKGDRVGLIGPSGAGKSTLAGVLSGLLPFNSGKMLVDGHDLTPEKAAAFAMQIGYVPQTPFLFAGTLAENIAFSTWGKPADTDRLRAACRQAAIDFVDTHPQGLEQPIGDNGAGLSGGQAQRVSIARAMYTRPSLIIFDEATSALDQANENAIQQTIDQLADNVTCLIIAHRLTTVEKCDLIVWMDNGRIVMQGPPADVLPAYIGSQTVK